MRDDLKQLILLQHQDREILKRREDLERIPREQENAKLRLSNDEKNLAEAQQALKDNQLAINKVELDIKTRRETVNRLKTQQFETRKNDEFRALAEEITRYEAQVDELETQELEHMVAADELRENIERAEQDLARTRGFVDEEIAALETRANHDRDELREFEVKRAALVVDIDPDLLATYERLFQTKKSLAVSAVNESRQCQGCHVKLTPATYLKVQAGKDLCQCDNCGRILYHE
ncbi:MAG: zinc ribbon domain-containing protein [Verrucomicrobiales bacterium]